MVCDTVWCATWWCTLAVPILSTIYVNDLIFELRNSGSGTHIGKLFMGCVLYADDIVLMSPTRRLAMDFKDLSMCVRARRCQGSTTESARSPPQRLYIPGQFIR